MDEKIVIIGAGSAMFTQGVVSDILRAGMKVDLALVDIDAEALETARRLVEKMIAAKKGAICLTAATDRKALLPGATAVITTIGVGGRRAWEQDVFIPRKFGLVYPVGDTVGPGGTSRALRMIPAMVAIARDVLDLAPQALFFNYANPMAAVCRAIRKASGAEVVGLCIGTHETWQYLAQALNTPPESLSFSAAGINHMTWFSGVQANGQDAMPALREIARKKIAAVNADLERARRGEGAMPHCGSPYDSSLDFPFSWQCLLWFDAYPAPQDRHVCEFFPQFVREGRYYGKTLGVDEFTFEGTIRDGDQIYEEMRDDALRPGALDDAYFAKMEGEQEQVIEILQSIRANRMMKFFANLPNCGQAPNLPAGAIVETPAVTDGRGIHAIGQDPLPGGVVGTLATRYEWVEMVVEAALEASAERRRKKFIEALILDGGVRSPEEAIGLADALLAAQQAYLA